MSCENLSPELQEELREAKSAEELERIAAEEGCELSDEAIEGIAGGIIGCLKLASCTSLRSQ